MLNGLLYFFSVLLENKRTNNKKTHKTTPPPPVKTFRLILGEGSEIKILTIESIRQHWCEGEIKNKLSELWSKKAAF